MTHEPSTPATSPRIIRGYYGRGYYARQRAELAGRGYLNKEPLEAPTRIEAPTLEEWATAYNVSVARIQSVLNEE
jgi:hypothetical protein